MNFIWIKTLLRALKCIAFGLVLAFFGTQESYAFQCKDLFAPKAIEYVNTKRLGFTPEFSQVNVRPGDFKIYVTPPTQTSHSLKEPIGELYYGISKDEKSVNIYFMKVNGKHSKKGLSNALFAKLLEIHPDILEIHTKLGRSNLSIIENALLNDISPLEALKETPAYKTRIKFGFTNIKEFKLIQETYDEIGRPSLDGEDFISNYYYLVVTKP